METSARAVDRLVALQAVTSELASVLDVPRIAEVVVDHGMRAVGASSAALWLVEGDHLRLARSLGIREQAHASNLLLPLSLDAPLCAAVKAGRPLLVGTPEEYAAAYPESVKRMASYGATLKGALACIPLVREGSAVGALLFEWDEARPFEHHDSTYLDLLAFHAVQALERGRLFTALRAAEEEALRAKAAAERAASAREELLAVVAHDLRNPLGIVQLTAQVMRRRLPEGDSDMKVLRDLEAIERNAMMMAGLIGDLLDVALIDARRLSVVRVLHPAAGILAEAVELVRPVADARGVTLEICGSLGGASLLCDRQRLLQVLGNLLGNAIRFAPHGSKVVVEASKEVDGTTFAVVDDGPGIPVAEREAVFEQWARGQRRDPPGEERSGVGLGLYIARGLVLAHDGNIWIESAREVEGVAAGTRVAFRLPGC